MESQSLGGLIKEHIFWSQDKDICDQCVRPWYDGICSCGHSNDKNIVAVREAALELIGKGVSLDKL